MATIATTRPQVAFTTGTRYACRSAGDHECVWTFTVTARTPRYVTLTDDCSGDVYRVGVKVFGGVEWCQPFGRYSMAPTLNAARPAE